MMEKNYIVLIVIFLCSLLATGISYCEDFTEREWDIYYTYLEYIDSSRDEDVTFEEIYRKITEKFGISTSEVKDIVNRAPDKPSELAYKVWNEIKKIPKSASEEEKNRRYKEIEKKYGITEKRRKVMTGWQMFYYEYYLKFL